MERHLNNGHASVRDYMRYGLIYKPPVIIFMTSIISVHKFRPTL
jgi:hypothetical protein